jgi:hypothetical protein
MYSLALIIFVVSEKKAFEHFLIGSNVNLCPAVVAILDFHEIQNGGYDRTKFNIGPYGGKCFKTLLILNHLDN